MKAWRWGLLVGMVGGLGACAHSSTQAENPAERQVTAAQDQSQKALQRASDAQAKADKAASEATSAENQVQMDQQALAKDQSMAQVRARDLQDKQNWVQKLSGELGVQPGQGYSAGNVNVPQADQKRLDKAQKDATDAQTAATEAKDKVAEDQRKLQDDQLAAKQKRERAIVAQKEAADVAQKAADVAQQNQERAVRAQQQQATLAKQNLPTVTGSLSSSSGNQIIVLPQGESTPLRLQVAGNTNITLDGQQAGIRDLPQGAKVHVSYAPGKSGLPEARKIEATSVQNQAPSRDTTGNTNP